MYSNSTDFNARICCESECEDQVWFLEDIGSSNDDHYRIINSQTDKCVVSDNTPTIFDVDFCTTYSDEYWTFEVNPDDDSFFRIKNVHSKLSIDNIFYNIYFN